jgi:hypothetical protein
MPPSSALHSALNAHKEPLAVADVSKAHDAEVTFRGYLHLTSRPDKPTLINLCKSYDPKLNA